MKEANSFTVAWGEIARTLVYQDKDGTLVFTFDFSDDPDPDGIRLEFGFAEGDPLRYGKAFDKVKTFIIAQGRNVYD